MSYQPKDHSKDVWKELGFKATERMMSHAPAVTTGLLAVTNLVLVVLVFILAIT